MDKQLCLRAILPGDTEILETFLYHAIHVPEGMESPPRSILEKPELRVYIEGYGTQPHDHGLAAVENGQVIGAAWVRDMPDYGHIEDGVPSFAISVLPEHRGRGVGTLLMQTLLEKLRQKGYAKASLAVQKTNRAVSLYQRLGFSIIGENAEEYLMVCHLGQTVWKGAGSMNWETCMQRCYQLAVSAGKKGFDTFGAVLVHNGQILEEAENTADYEKGFFGHAEFNLVHQCAGKYPDAVLKKAVLFTSCAPCERCLCAIASLGIETVVCGVSYKAFSQLTPFDYAPVDREGLLGQLGIRLRLVEGVLEDEGMHVFEWWGGEYHPLAELIAEMDEVKKTQGKDHAGGV